jgi:hypothetical protein
MLVKRVPFPDVRKMLLRESRLRLLAADLWPYLIIISLVQSRSSCDTMEGAVIKCGCRF